MKNEMKKTSVNLGADSSKLMASEAQQQFVLQTTNQAGNNAANANLKNKLTSDNFSLREQKQGGLVNNYF